MSDIANITIVGHLTRNPETTETSNSSVTKFSLAVNGWKDDDVSYIDCDAWGKVGEVVQKYCEKGKQVVVAGTLRIDKWEDKEGNKRSKPVVNVRDVTLLGSKDEAKSTEPKQETVEVASDELPF
jgi:single-strand DNA-binding protein